MSQLFTTLAQSNSSGGGGLVLGGGLLIVIFLIGIAAFAFWIWMLIDVLQSSRPTNEKILWVILMVFLGVLGSLIYLVVARSSAAGRSV
jgi:Phospholipase_D-nuclease N-terminal